MLADDFIDIALDVFIEKIVRTDYRCICNHQFENI